MSAKIKICIAGTNGYVGKELIKLVAQHPHLELVGILAKESASYSEEYVNTNKITIYCMSDLMDKQNQIDVLLLATPPQASIDIVAFLQNSPIRIIDLSGAFRLPQQELNEWYEINHTLTKFQQGAAYGLSPWLKHYSNLKLLANPGCYATCALMSLIPLLKKDIIQNKNIIIDAKSGTTGAGKQANPELMFSEMTENFFPYKIGKHQHIPEITNALTNYTNKPCDIHFITHMLPVKRGISISIYADANKLFKSEDDIAYAIEDAYQTSYMDYPLIKFAKIDQENTHKNKYLLALKNVVNTPNIHVSYLVDKAKVLIFACMDNLLKGAASQAIENVNSLYEWPIDTGLKNWEGIV